MKPTAVEITLVHVYDVIHLSCVDALAVPEAIDKVT